MSTFEEAVQGQLALVRSRWQGGIDRFADAFDEGFRTWVASGKPEAPAKVIRTAVYGDVTLSRMECLLLDSFFVQRLRNISQMGLLHYVYPDARHSRFEHSLGVFWMMRELAARKDWEANLPTPKLRALMYAALLHDIGHGPFSHTSEQLLDLLGLAKRLRRVKSPTVKPKYHEIKSGEMVLDCDHQLLALGRTSYGLRDALRRLDTDPNCVVGNIWGDPGDPVSALVNGPLDVDKMDYYQRDSFQTGALAGGIDVEYMMRVLRFEPTKSHSPFFEEKAFGPVLQMIFNREYVYASTAFHPVVRVVQAMFLVALEAATSLLSPVLFNDVIFHMDLMDDGDVWSFMDAVVASTGNTTKGAVLKDLAERLRSRRLYKRLATLPVEDCARYGFSSKEETVDLDLVPLRYVTRGDIEESADLRILGLADDEVLIFEAYPVPDRPGAAKPFRAIQIEARGTVGSLYDKLGSQALVRAYEATQDRLFKALVIGPEHAKEKFTAANPPAQTRILCELARVLKERGQPDPKGMAEEERFETLTKRLAEIAQRKKSLGMAEWCSG
jgi:uncharacterized protein